MTTIQIWQSIRILGKECWQFANPTGGDGKTITIELLNGPTSGVRVFGATGMLRNQLLNRGSGIREILMAECATTFPYPRVDITVGGVVPAPASPSRPQDPPAPPIIIPALPPTTPPTSNDKTYFV